MACAKQQKETFTMFYTLKSLFHGALYLFASLLISTALIILIPLYIFQVDEEEHIEYVAGVIITAYFVLVCGASYYLTAHSGPYFWYYLFAAIVGIGVCLPAISFLLSPIDNMLKKDSVLENFEHVVPGSFFIMYVITSAILISDINLSWGLWALYSTGWVAVGLAMVIYHEEDRRITT